MTQCMMEHTLLQIGTGLLSLEKFSKSGDLGA